jgi:hypothetical protein
MAQVSRFLPIILTRKIATMLASTTATMPPADVVGVGGEFENAERKVGRRRPAVGGDTDFGEDVEQEYGLYQYDDGDRARDVRQHDIEKERDRSGVVELGGLLLLFVERLQRGQQNQAGERQPLPSDDQHDREHGTAREPIDHRQAERVRDPGEQSGNRVHQHVLPDQPADGGHHEERGDHHHADDVLAKDGLIHQQRHENSADDAQDQYGKHENESVFQRSDEVGVG